MKKMKILKHVKIILKHKDQVELTKIISKAYRNGSKTENIRNTSSKEDFDSIVDL